MALDTLTFSEKVARLRDAHIKPSSEQPTPTLFNQWKDFRESPRPWSKGTWGDFRDWSSKWG